MIVRWIGAAMIVMGCGGVGFSMAAQYGKELKMMRQLEDMLTFMTCELEYKMTPLPQLLKNGAASMNGSLKGVILAFAEELEENTWVNAPACLAKVLKGATALPGRVNNVLREMSACLGVFDLPGQISTLQALKDRCHREVSFMEENRAQQTRSYQTLGLCAGAALAVLFV